jgi:hypothetical protein
MLPLPKEGRRGFSTPVSISVRTILSPESIQSERLSFQWSELDPPPPHPQANVAAASGPRGETRSLAGEGLGLPSSGEGADTLILYVYYNPSTF